jgi:hypothetical protein
VVSKEIITEIIEDLENTVGLNWPARGRVTREKLIECWSEYRKESDSTYFGYVTKNFYRVYKKIFANINKPNISESWKDYILRLYNFKYCYKCEELHNISKFNVDNSRAGNIKNNCKFCQSNYSKQYCKTEKGKLINSIRAAKRRAAKLQRTPAWLTEEDHWMFEEIYSLAKLREELTGVKWHVDHKIPLQGENVCGLHVPTNLQVITATENLNKSNNYIGE